ncbi:MAG: trehalase family glycosidase, partial [Bacteroidia bacterium]|nr:trehalase family glycosidase [Bacteroidia bacterium]
MKPFLAQGVWLASVILNDFTWIEPHYAAMLKVLEYRDKTQFDPKYGLYFWDIAMQSGADNNPALNYFTDDKRSFLACDASTWQLRELIAQANIAGKLGKTEDEAKFRARAGALKAAINKILWCEKDQIFYNVDRETGDFYKRVSFSCFIPLVEKIAPEHNGSEMIRRYLINPDHMKAEFGFRSLSKMDPDYNN